MTADPLWLYTTAGCHLCAQLEATLLMLGAQVVLTRIEIADDAQLIERYAMRIPVLVTEAGSEFSLVEALPPQEEKVTVLMDWLMAQGVVLSPSTPVSSSLPDAVSSESSMHDGRRFLR